MAAKRILLVEDSENDIVLTLSALGKHHLANDVVVTRDGEEALDYLHRRGAHAGRPPGNPVLIMLDLKMPKVTGLEVLRAIKADPGLRLIPVVILTSSAEQRDVEECYELGANAYVVKPVEFEKFIAAVLELGLFWMILNEPPPYS
jgi:CheY-like chemotaxis protein